MALAMSSMTGWPRKMIRSLRSRLKTWASSPMSPPARSWGVAGVATPSVDTTRPVDGSFLLTAPASVVPGEVHPGACSVSGQ